MLRAFSASHPCRRGSLNVGGVDDCEKVNKHKSRSACSWWDLAWAKSRGCCRARGLSVTGHTSRSTRPLEIVMPATPHIEKHFMASESVRHVIIGMADGLTVPFTGGRSVGRRGEHRRHRHRWPCRSSGRSPSRWVWAVILRHAPMPSTTRPRMSRENYEIKHMR